MEKTLTENRRTSCRPATLRRCRRRSTAAKKAVQGDDLAAITQRHERLQKASHQMAESLYKATQAGAPPEGGADSGGAKPADGEVVDAEFSETK